MTKNISKEDIKPGHLYHLNTKEVYWLYCGEICYLEVSNKSEILGKITEAANIFWLSSNFKKDIKLAEAVSEIKPKITLTTSKGWVYIPDKRVFTQSPAEIACDLSHNFHLDTNERKVGSLEVAVLDPRPYLEQIRNRATQHYLQKSREHNSYREKLAISSEASRLLSFVNKLREASFICSQGTVHLAGDPLPDLIDNWYSWLLGDYSK